MPLPNNHTDTHVDSMIFNILTSDQYNTLRTGNNLSSNELYFITDDVLKSLLITFDGGTTEDNNKFTYDGSDTKIINITPENINALRTTGTAVAAKKLANYYTSRPSNANITHESDGSMVIFKSTSTMTSNKPASDGHITHWFWDDSNQNDAQLFISSGSTPTMQFRTQNNGTWSDWITIATTTGTINVADHVGHSLAIDNKTYDGSTSVSVGNTIYYVIGNTTGTEGAWTGSIAGLTELYTGLTIAYKVGIAGASTTNLNINNLGNHIVYRNNSKMTSTHVVVGSVMIFVYDGTYWRWSDYDSNSNTLQRTYRLNANVELPIAGQSTSTSGAYTQSSSNSYEAAYGVIPSSASIRPTINPSTGTITATKFNGPATSVEHSLIVKFNGGTTTSGADQNMFTYNGSGTITIDITPESIGALSATTGALTAQKWSIPRDFYIADADDTNTGTATSVDGSADVTLNLPSTIKATLTGNASSANKVNNSLLITLNNGTTEDNNKFTFDGSSTKTINITPASIGALSTSGSAASAEKWTTAREFKISDADATNTSAGVNVDGSGNVTLKLPSTIKASITGNASTATKLNNSLIIKFNNGSTEGNNLFTYTGESNKTIDITPANINAINKSGDTMNGDLTFAKDKKIKFIKEGSTGLNTPDRTISFGTTGQDGGGDTAVTRFAFSVAPSGQSQYVAIDNIVTDSGSNPHYAASVEYVNNKFAGAASSNHTHQTLLIQFNGGQTEDNNQFSYNGGTTKTVNITPAKVGAVAKSGDTMTGLLTLSGDPTSAMHAVTKQYADGLIAAADAMRYRGTISGNSTTPGTMTPAANAGDTYRVDTAGLINGEPVEVGDLLICNTDNTAAATTSTYSSISAKWNIIQVNVDKAVYYGSNSLTSGAVLVGDSSTGKVKNPGAVGSNTQPIYLSGAGIPTAIEYTANRLYYPSDADTFTAGTHYVSGTKLSINSTSSPGTNYVFYVNGGTTTAGDIDVVKGNTAQPQVTVSNGTHKAALMVGSGGTNHGIYSHTSTAKWIIYREGAGNVYVPDWGSIGDATHPVYISSSGRPVATTYEIAGKVSGGTANRIAWYKGSNEIAAADTHYISNAQIHIGATTKPDDGYSLFVTSKAKFIDGLYLPNNKSIYQIQNDSSNYTTAISWLKNGTGWADNTYQPSIGQHNTGGSDSKGAIVILPYATNTSPWGRTVGLYIAKNKLTLDNKVVPNTNNATGTVGSATQGVYVNAGTITAMTYSLASSVGTGTQYGVAYFSGTNAIASTAAGGQYQALVGQSSSTAGAPVWRDINTTVAWAQASNTGTTGPNLTVTVLGKAGSANIPVAATDAAGVVTAGAQSFAGAKTFTGAVSITDATNSTNKSTGALKVSGGVGVIGQVSALRYMVDDHVTLQYNATTQSLDFIFN